MNKKLIGVAAAIAFISTVIIANWLTTVFGFIPVGFGLMATAGTLIAGAALALRDVVQDGLGRIAVLGMVVAGAALSFIVSDPFIALASGAAFLISELLDYAVYTPLRKRSRLGDRRWAVAVGASNVVGAVVDTIVFIGIAFGAGAILEAIPGQLVGKMWATLAFLIVGAVVGRVLLRKRREVALAAAEASTIGG